MNDFARVKEALNLEEVITRETGFKMKRHHLEECPFCGGHDCFSIRKDGSGYKCFQCPEQGDVFTFLEKYHSITKKEALERAASMAGIELPHKNKPNIRFSVNEKILLEAAKYYHSNMLKNGVLDYLTTKRGHRIEILNNLKVGFSDGQLLDHLRHKKFSDADIIKSGLARERTIDGTPRLFDFFCAGLVIYPHFVGEKVRHFTMKDPKKKKAYQLPADKRHKEWLFYNQDALDRYDEIILVEGENDLQSVLDSGVMNVIGLIGQVSEVQIKALAARCRKKTLYIWMDNDPPNEKGKRPGHDYVRKIWSGIKDIDARIIIYPDDMDPDKYLQNFKGDRRKEIKRLQDEAVDYITWEIIQAGRMSTLEEKLESLKAYKVFRKITLQPQIRQQIYSEKLEAIGFTKAAIAEQLEDNLDLRRKLNVYFETLQKKADADPIVISDIIYRFFADKGRFFKDSTNNVYLFYNNHIYTVGNNRPFNALLKRLAGLLPTKEPGRSTWEALASDGHNFGLQVNFASWIYTDRASDTIFLNLNTPDNVVLKLNRDTIKEIPNGLNEDNILLKSSNNILPFNYLPDANIREGFTALKELILDNLTCEKEQRYLILCWTLSAFLIDFVKNQALMKFAGATSSGKTTGAKLMSLLIFGNEDVGAPSAAAAFAEASQNPLLLIDNLESEDITNAMKNFLLLSATGGNKTKRTSGTESDTTKEKPKALVLVTAIEPFTKSELINRTIEIEFSQKFKTDDFFEDEVTRELLKKRDLIISSILKLITKKILPHLKVRKNYMAILKKEYKRHAKDRMNEHFSLLMLILEKILPYIPYYSDNDSLYGYDHGDKEIRKAWIEYQNARAKETESGSNIILKLLNGLMREYILQMADKQIEPTIVDGYDDKVFIYKHPEYGLTIVKTKPEALVDKNGEDYIKSYIEFEATSGELASVFDLYCKNNGLKNPFSNGSILSARLRNDRDMLAQEGWHMIVKNTKLAPYYRISEGKRFYKFQNILIR